MRSKMEILFLVGMLGVIAAVSVSVSIRSWGRDRLKIAAPANTEPKPPTVTDSSPMVDTPDGKYAGVLKTLPDGSQIIKYMGISFAQPPVGNLRFKRPQPLPKGTPNNIIKADKPKLSCNSVTKIKPDPRYGEDCLYLNVYIPVNQNQSSSQNDKPYSVMIWLHGGGFVAGSAFPEPNALVSRGNVIVVMVNYRMGVFGFLTTNDDVLPGNNGLWDQYMAIKWVKENIRHFGGDQNSITVFGESAGSTSTHVHALSPISSNLFQKVILQSGTLSLGMIRDYVNYSYQFGQMVGCGNFSSHTELAKCLRSLSVEDILQNDLPQNFNLTMARRQIDFIWGPIVDGEIIVDEPARILKNKTYLDSIGAYEKDYMIGVLDNEGGLIVDNFLNPIPLSTLRNESFYNDLLDSFFYDIFGLNPQQTSSMKAAVNRLYFGSENLTYPLTEQAVLDVASDAMFISSALSTALTMSMCNKTLPPLCQEPASKSGLPKIEPDPICSKATAKVFFYSFDYCPSNDPCRVPCMSHGSDVAYEFPRRIFPDKEQNQMSEIFIDVLTTFAKTSDPGASLNSGWPAYEPYNQRYLRLSPQPAVRQQLHPYRTKLWLDYIPRIVDGGHRER